MNSYEYDVWGNFITKQETIDNPFTYFGQTYDETTGLYYLRARYYDPQTGRFTQQDPAEDGYNWYVYGNQNPVMYVDYTGEGAEGILSGAWSFGVGAASLDGPFPYGDIIGGAIGVGGTIIAGGYWLYKTLTKYFADTKAKAIADAMSKIKTENPNDTIIFRSGNGTYNNLTPRDIDTNGLSYYLVPPETGTYTVTTIESINKTGVMTAVIDGQNHVSVKGIYNHNEWMESKPNAESCPHYNTVLLKSISIKIKIK